MPNARDAKAYAERQPSYIIDLVPGAREALDKVRALEAERRTKFAAAHRDAIAERLRLVNEDASETEIHYATRDLKQAERAERLQQRKIDRAWTALAEQISAHPRDELRRTVAAKALEADEALVKAWAAVVEAKNARDRASAFVPTPRMYSGETPHPLDSFTVSGEDVRVWNREAMAAIAEEAIA